jgi:hypothetical protein
MAHASTLHPLGCHRRSVFLFGPDGAQPWYRDRVIKELQKAGLNVVVAKLICDRSEKILRAIHREPDEGSDPGAKPH